MTTLRQHLHTLALVSPNYVCEEEPSSTLNTLISNGSLREGRGWWCPAPPARAWLLHLRPPAGRACAPIPPYQPSSPTGQQRRPRRPFIQTMALGHCTGCTVLAVSRSHHLLWPEQKRASLCHKPARCIPGFGMKRHMDEHQQWMKKHSVSLRIIY